jgi:hypothetical protein
VSKSPQQPPYRRRGRAVLIGLLTAIFVGKAVDKFLAPSLGVNLAIATEFAALIAGLTAYYLAGGGKRAESGAAPDPARDIDSGSS